MTTALIYLLVMLLVAGVVFLLAAVVFGRGEELEPLPPGVSPTQLPATDINGDDVAQVRFQLVVRGYKMSEVDWVMQRLGADIDELRERLAQLEAPGGDSEPTVPPGSEFPYTDNGVALLGAEADAGDAAAHAADRVDKVDPQAREAAEGGRA